MSPACALRGTKSMRVSDVRTSTSCVVVCIAATAALVRATGLRITGSGGVSSLQDLRNLKDAGCAGAILGRAMYEKAFTLAEALACVKEDC